MTAQLSHQPGSALRQRMIEDMSVRGVAEVAMCVRRVARVGAIYCGEDQQELCPLKIRAR